MNERVASIEVEHETERAALIRKFAGGVRLNAEENAVVATIIPATAAVVKRVTSETYKLTLREYAEQFRQSGMEASKDAPRKLKHWVRHGREDKDGNLRDEPDLPPFDQPSELAAWWRRNMVYRPPDWMVALEKDLNSARLTEERSSPPSSSPPPTAPVRQADDTAETPVSYGDLKIESDLAADFTIKILASAAMDAVRRYDKARAEDNIKAARLYLEEVTERVTMLQRAKLEAQKLLASTGDYLQTARVSKSISLLLSMQDTSIVNAFDDLLRDVCPLMESEERRRRARAQRDKVFSHWHKTEFGEVWTPEVAAA